MEPCTSNPENVTRCRACDRNTVDKLEQVQKRATKLIPELSKTYSERLKILNLPTMKYRRHRGDMIELFKIIKEIYDSTSVPDVETHGIIRGFN